MTDEELRSGGPPETFDYTMGDTWEDCPAKLYFFLRGVQTLEEPSYFVSGRAWTNGLAAWYMTSGAQQDRLDAARAAIIKTYGTARQYDFEQPRSMENLINLFSLYVLQYPTEPWRMIAAETGWVYPLSDFYLGGAMDGYIRWDPYGPINLENKTTLAYVTEQTLAQYRLNLQVTQYIWGLQKIVGETVWGSLVNIAFLRIMKDAQKAMQFARSIEQRSPNELESFEENWKQRVRAIRSMWPSGSNGMAQWRRKYSHHLWLPIHHDTPEPVYREWSWPQLGRFCGGGYGLKPCPYFWLCTMSPDVTKVHVPENIYCYRPRWAPWERGEPHGNS